MLMPVVMKAASQVARQLTNRTWLPETDEAARGSSTEFGSFIPCILPQRRIAF